MNKKDVLEILYLERDRLHQRHNVPGWNVWVAIGGLSAIVWTFIIILEEYHFNPTEVIRYFLICLLSFYSIRMVYNRMIIKDYISDLRVNRFVYFSSISDQRFPFSLHILIFSALVYIHSYYNYIDEFYFSIFKYASILILSLLAIIIGLSYLEFPVNYRPPNKVVSFLITIFFSLLCAFIIYGLVIDINSNEFSFAPLEFGVLIFGFHYLLFLLIELGRPNHLLSKIDDLIDGILFDRIDSKEVLNELEILILGLELKAIFEKPMSTYFNKLEIFNQQVSNIVRLADQFQRQLEDATQLRHDSDEDLIKADQCLTSLEDTLTLVNLYQKQTSEALAEVEKSIKPLVVLLSYLKPFGVASTDINTISQQISERYGHSKKQSGLMVERVEQMSKDFIVHCNRLKTLNAG